MAKSVEPFTWVNGFQEPSSGAPWHYQHGEDDGDDCYVTPPFKEVVTAERHNQLGINVLRTWPTIYDGTNNPHGLQEWWKPLGEVDVLICGAGPSGLEVALSLVRQGVSFRIIDKAEGPLIAGRADGVQPRFLEILNTWGLAQEVHEEGPLIERTAIYKDGKKVLFTRSHQSDSRYRGLHIITQGQIERIYVRDLLRHRMLVERSCTLASFEVGDHGSHPVRATIVNHRTNKQEEIRAKFLVGSDGAASMVRKSVGIPFDGVSTSIYWGIMDCKFETDYPHAWIFGSVISSTHGGCVIIPREDGYIRLYTQLDVSLTGPLATSRQSKQEPFSEAGGQVDVHTITPEEVLEQANRIFAPYTLGFGAPLSWFAVWKISERVARSFSSKDLRVHLAGDAAHVHSVMGAFGLNASIMDASNLAWKMGLVCQGRASLEKLMPTYNFERRDHACRIVEVSGEYLRFVCNASISLAHVRDPEKLAAELSNGTPQAIYNVSAEDPNKPGSGADQADGKEALPHAVNAVHISNSVQGTIRPTEQSATSTVSTTAKSVESDSHTEALQFLASFFGNHGKFLLGVDAPFGESVLTPSSKDSQAVIRVRNGVRAPNPRLCLSKSSTGYLYDELTGAAMWHVVIFASTMHDGVRRRISTFVKGVFGNTKSFYHRYGRSALFNFVVILKCLPDEAATLMSDDESKILLAQSTIMYDDRAPDEDAHTTYGVSHSSGAVVIIRPDLWVGTSARPDNIGALEAYFDGFLV